MPSSPRDFPDSAEDWLARLLSPECGANDHAAFEDWLAASPRNALDYVEIERIHQMVGTLEQDQTARSTGQPPTASTPAVRRRRAWRPALAWAASLLVALGGGLWLTIGLRQATPMQYATEIGEQRRMELPDGTGLFLDTHTQVRVAYGRSQRHVELLSGRVQANVVSDASRPFVVTSGVGTVRALGTVFQVQRQNGNTVVSLLQGRVVVDTRDDQSSHVLELRPLQQLTYDANGRFGPRTHIDRGAEESWIHGQLTFKEERLADLIAEFNRYSQDQLILSETALGDIRISGVFNASDQVGLLAALRDGWGLQAKRNARNQIELSASKQ